MGRANRSNLPVKLTTTAVAWRNHIFAWQESGLSQTEYCLRHVININQFWNWKSRFNRAGVTKKVRSKPPAEQFVAVTVTDSDTAARQTQITSGDSGIIVVISRSIEIHLACCFDSAALVKAVIALASTGA